MNYISWEAKQRARSAAVCVCSLEQHTHDGNVTIITEDYRNNDIASVKFASFIERKCAPLGFVVFVITYFHSLISQQFYIKLRLS